MEITKTNFYEKLPEVKDAIDSALFVSVDCEFTGLNTIYNINAFDTPKQYYDKIRKNSKDFIVLQFGLCTFQYCSKTKSFIQKAFNFYTFPRPTSKMYPDQRFLCQASSIDFLISRDFDFNKVFKEGISYMNQQVESKYRAELEEKRNYRAEAEERRSKLKQQVASPQTNLIPVPEEHKPFVDDVLMKIEEFIESDKDEQVLPRCNAFVRKLIYQSVEEKFNEQVILKSKTLENKERAFIVARPKSPEDMKIEEEAEREIEDQELQKAIGFSEVIRYLSESRKLIIGHNMMLDLCHIIDKFLTTLPEDYDSFKECVHCLFPNLLDTKLMSTNPEFSDHIKSTVLPHLLATLSEEPFNMPKVDSGQGAEGYSTLVSSKEHEAGYDAYITGLCFITMWKYLGDCEQLESPFENFDLIESFTNRLFLMRIQDCPFIELDGNDPTPPRDHVFYMTFPKSWKSHELVKLFNPFGSIYIDWIDDHSAYIALQPQNRAAIALSTLSQSDTYRIMTYARRQAILEGNPILATSPLSRRRRSSDTSAPPSKKRKSSNNWIESNVFKRTSVESVKEIEISNEGESEDSTVPLLIKPRKRTLSKTFAVDNDW